MKITGSYDIEADRQAVWEALNDPDVLRDCIPGCDSLEMTGENELTATVTAKVGPVKAKFNGQVELKDLNPPESYRIEGSGKGGAAGFAKGGANVVLTETEGGGTNLSYEADAQVGGKLAQIGGRLIDGTAKKMADQFFASFRERVAGGGGGEAATEEEAAPDKEPAVEVEPSGDPDPAPAPEAPKPAAEAEPKTVEESAEEQAEREEAAKAAATAAVAGAGVAPEAGHAVPPAGGEDSKSGLPAWVWFVGAVALILVLVALVT
jgi:hypothetical protein